MAKASKSTGKATKEEPINNGEMTVEQVVMEINKLLDPKIQILSSALDMVCQEFGVKGIDYILKVLNFVEVPQEEGQPKKYKQVVPDTKSQVPNAQ